MCELFEEQLLKLRMSGRIGILMLYLIMLGGVDDILIRLKIFGL